VIPVQLAGTRQPETAAVQSIVILCCLSLYGLFEVLPHPLRTAPAAPMASSMFGFSRSVAAGFRVIRREHCLAFGKNGIAANGKPGT